MTSVRRPPSRMPVTPKSQPLMTRPAPSGKSKGAPRSQEESNCLPSENDTLDAADGDVVTGLGRRALADDDIVARELGRRRAGGCGDRGLGAEVVGDLQRLKGLAHGPVGEVVAIIMRTASTSSAAAARPRGSSARQAAEVAERPVDVVAQRRARGARVQRGQDVAGQQLLDDGLADLRNLDLGEVLALVGRDQQRVDRLAVGDLVGLRRDRCPRSGRRASDRGPRRCWLL